MELPSKSELILKEMDYLQSIIARFDNTGINIKAWSITVWSALIAYSYKEEKLELLAAAILAAASFAFVEFVYRVYQRRFICRMSKIENIINESLIDEYSFQLDKYATTPVAHGENILGDKKSAFLAKPISNPTLVELRSIGSALYISGLYYFQIVSTVILILIMVWFDGN